MTLKPGQNGTKKLLARYGGRLLRNRCTRRTAMSTEQEPEMSPLSRAVTCEGQELRIDIYRDNEGRWSLTVTNHCGVMSHWTKQFKSDKSALKEAIKTIKEEGLEGFHMEQPYKLGIH